MGLPPSNICNFGAINAQGLMNIRSGSIIFLLGIVLCGCSLNNNIMLKTPADYEFDDPPDDPEVEYRISADDRVQFQLYANNGFQLVNVTPVGNQGSGGGRRNRGGQGSGGLDYKVEKDGRVKLPVLGKVPITGNTVREAERMLEEKYSEFYKDPFVLLEVTNKRVIIFPGSGGDAQVVTLQNDNTTLMEVLAMAGGIPERGKAATIKLIRKNKRGERRVFKVDLSRIDGLKYADMVVQADDIIYVEPRKRIATEILRDINPYLSLLSTSIFIYTTLTQF